MKILNVVKNPNNSTEVRDLHRDVPCRSTLSNAELFETTGPVDVLVFDNV